MRRVVSLLSSATEIVCGLGHEKSLVGRSHECDFPESIRHLPACSSPKFPTDGSSYEIDQRIKAIVQEGLSVYRVDADALKRLAPDLILTQTQCHVCAVGFSDVKIALRDCLDVDAEIISLEPYDLAGVWRDIRQVAKALGDVNAGESFIEALEARMREIEQRAKTSKPLTALCIEWIDPLLSAGHWIPELMAMLNVELLFGEVGKHSPKIDLDRVVKADPDFIIVAPCGWDILKTKEEMQVLSDDPRWKKLKAVEKNRVYLSDGNQFFNRPGPRLVETLEILAEIARPQDFSFGHYPKDWKPLTS